VPHYTYRQDKTEEKTLYRRLAIIGGITIILLIALAFWGVTFISIIGRLGTKGEDETTRISFEIPLQKPSLTSVPEFTNKDEITISGTTTSEASLVLYVNGTQISRTIADTSGNFSFIDVSLKEGLNLIKVIASNAAGDNQEERVLITLDKIKPELKITSPTNGQSFPKDTDTITIKGVTEPDSTVLINSIQGTLDQDGNFAYTLSVTVGKNKIEVKSTDKAGNSNIEKLSITVGD